MKRSQTTGVEYENQVYAVTLFLPPLADSDSWSYAAPSRVIADVRSDKLRVVIL